MPPYRFLTHSQSNRECLIEVWLTFLEARVINAAFLASACSAACSDMYTSSRALHGLALVGNAPPFLKQTNRQGVPWICVLVSCLMGLLSFMSLGPKGAGEVFNWLASSVRWTSYLWTSSCWWMWVSGRARNVWRYQRYVICSWPTDLDWDLDYLSALGFRFEGTIHWSHRLSLQVGFGDFLRLFFWLFQMHFFE